MALAVFKTYVPAEVFFASDLNSSLTTIHNNPMSLISPWTASLAAAGFDLTDLDELEFRDATADPTADGRLRRNGDTLTFRAQDGRTTTTARPFALQADTTGTPAVSIGVGMRFDAESADENPSQFGALDFVATDVTAASEDTVLDVFLRVAGAALTAVYRFVSTAAFRAIFTHANTADRTYTLPDATTTLVGTDTTQTLSAKILVPASLSGTPVQHGLYQENVPKVWANVTITPTLGDSFNMTSVADAGAGLVTITFDRDFANTTYVVIGSSGGSTLTTDREIVSIDTLALGSARVSLLTDASVLADVAFMFVAFGDQ